MRNLIYILFFALGFLSCMLLVYSLNLDKEMPLGGSSENIAPGDWIEGNEIHVYDNAVCIDIEDASLSSYAATGSMKPTFDENANGIRIKPKSDDEIKAGDIISFEQNGELIVHRVIEKGLDSEGVYFITQGDNNNASDSRIRFEQIKYVTIGVLY